MLAALSLKLRAASRRHRDVVIILLYMRVVLAIVAVSAVSCRCVCDAVLSLGEIKGEGVLFLASGLEKN